MAPIAGKTPRDVRLRRPEASRGFRTRCVSRWERLVADVAGFHHQVVGKLVLELGHPLQARSRDRKLRSASKVNMPNCEVLKRAEIASQVPDEVREYHGCP